MTNAFTSYPAKDVGTGASTLTTVAVGKTVILIGAYIANTSSAQISASMYYTRSGVDYYLVKNAPIPVGGALAPVGGGIKKVLIAGDVLKVISDTSSSCDADVSALEIT